MHSRLSRADRSAAFSASVRAAMDDELSVLVGGRPAGAEAGDKGSSVALDARGLESGVFCSVSAALSSLWPEGYFPTRPMSGVSP